MRARPARSELAELPTMARTARRTPSRIPIPQAAGACTAFAAFAVSVLVGMASSNPLETILWRAILAMGGGFVCGFAVGLVCDWIVAHEVSAIERASADAVSAGSAGEDTSDGLGDVEIVEEPDESLAAQSVQSENRDAVGGRREKNAA